MFPLRVLNSSLAWHFSSYERNSIRLTKEHYNEGSFLSRCMNISDIVISTANNATTRKNLLKRQNEREIDSLMVGYENTLAGNGMNHKSWRGNLSKPFKSFIAPRIIQKNSPPNVPRKPFYINTLEMRVPFPVTNYGL